MKETLAKAAIFIFICFGTGAFAQKTDPYNDPDRYYFEALELLYKEKYAAAREIFGEIARSQKDVNSETGVNAAYYEAYSALQLFNKDAEFLLIQFLNNHPESKWVQSVYYQLGNYNYRKKSFDEALVWFSKVDEYDLPEEERTALYFKRGFSQYNEGLEKEAMTTLFVIKDRPGDYYGPSNYYYGHLAYSGGNYQQALDAFNRLLDDEAFGPVVPYYIAQIYYLQERYDELIEYAPRLLEADNSKRSGEIARLLGDAYYQREQYEEAIPYLEQYQASTGSPSRKDNYQLGYAAYRAGQYEKAVTFLGKVNQEEDSLSQIATYQLGDSYVKLDQKKFARNAFKVAGTQNFDREITEDALFNYAKLSYELSFDPFDEAIQAFKQYLQKYPDSPRKDEAYEFLLKVYLTTKNYGSALEALDQISNKDIRHESAFQISAYNHGIENFQQRNEEKAIELFRKSRRYNHEPEVAALSHYWEGEAWFRLQDFNKSKTSYQAFRNAPGAYNTPIYNEASYNLGYASFRQSRFSEALQEFRKYLGSNSGTKMKQTDAMIRAADCYLVMKDYENAISYYQNAIANKGAASDYALFQMAMAKGYQEKNSEKIADLKKMIREYPNSNLMASAKYEAGDAALLLNRLEEAATFFSDVITDHPSSTYVKRSLLRNGLVQYRQSKFDEAIASFQKVMEDYPSDEVSGEAMNILQNIYVELGRVEEYSNWVTTLPSYNVSTSALDSLTYQAAENQYTAGNCNKALEAFSQYLQKFTPGIFAVNAHYYSGECDYKAGEFNQALEHYEFVISNPVNKFSEPALLGAATINYNNKNYEAALANYEQLEEVAQFSTNVLEAQIGQLRCSYYLGNNQRALQHADAVIGNDKTPENILAEARLFKGRILFDNNDLENAREVFASLVETSRGKEGAEAQFRLANIAFQQDDMENAESEIFKLIQNYPAFEYWKIRAFILLADVYLKLDDPFQAKATLRSVIDNARDENLVKQAQNNLDEINRMEEEERRQKDLENTPQPDEVEQEYDELITPDPPADQEGE